MSYPLTQIVGDDEKEEQFCELPATQGSRCTEEAPAKVKRVPSLAYSSKSYPM
ncbi:MAG: hypothetical protein P9L91_01495 [Candidatus Zophobacter franzmannii]|nr:hypothetical protein [Candidatus Zophobacter franzmannii]